MSIIRIFSHLTKAIFVNLLEKWTLPRRLMISTYLYRITQWNTYTVNLWWSFTMDSYPLFDWIVSLWRNNRIKWNNIVKMIIIDDEVLIFHSEKTAFPFIIPVGINYRRKEHIHCNYCRMYFFMNIKKITSTFFLKGVVFVVSLLCFNWVICWCSNEYSSYIQILTWDGFWIRIIEKCHFFYLETHLVGLSSQGFKKASVDFPSFFSYL